MRPLLMTALSLGLSMAALTTPAAAQSARIERAQVYRSILPSEMATLLHASDYASVSKPNNNVFDVVTNDGFRFSVEITACDVEGLTPGCFGIVFYSTWSLEPGDRSKVSAVVDRFNDDFRIGKAFLLTEVLYAERYITTDGGVTEEHILEEAATFLGMMGQLGERLHEAVGS